MTNATRLSAISNHAACLCAEVRDFGSEGAFDEAMNAPLRVGKEDWNQQSVDIAWQPPPYTSDGASAVYAASKTEGERALWRLLEEQRPHFVANAILPNVIQCEYRLAVLSDSQLR